MKGSCLCQAVEYSVQSLLGPIYFCHCEKCRKAHAAPFNATAGADRAGFQWTKGEEHLGAFESSPGKKRWFCRQCGSHLMAEWTDKPHVIVRVATLDDDPGAEIKGHIWVSHDLPWLNYGDEIARYWEKPLPGSARVPALLRSDQIKERVHQTVQWLTDTINRHLPSARIEHVGSSAVPGLYTKGDVDVMVEVSSAEFDDAHARLRGCFTYNPEMAPEKQFVSFSGEYEGTDYGVQLCASENKLIGFVEFRDALRTSPDLAQRYNDLKLRHQSGSMDEYRAAKAAFVEEILSNQS